MTKKLLKIALVYDAIYPYVKGGGEKRFYELAKRLTIEGFEVHLYGMKYWDGPNVIQQEGVYLHGLMKARPLYNKTGNRTISQAILFGLSCFKLMREDFDVIDCCGFPYFSLFPAKIAAILKRKQLFATWHEVWGIKYWKQYLGILGYFGFAVEWIASRLPNIIIANSDQTASLLKNNLKTKREVIVIPNGIDLEEINAAKPARNTSEIIYAGRLMDFKNIDLLLNAVALAKEKGNKYKCTIIGKGPEENSLHKLAKKLSIENQITWLGFLDSSQDLYGNLKHSKVFVQPSKREGFGIIAIEANACGLPVLTLDHQNNATRNLIQQGKNGYLFSNDTTDLTDKLDTAIKQRDSLVNICKNTATKYDWNNIVRDLSGEYTR
jgi:glycosyltransferase involved in cell wall biosynthesis